MRSVEIHILHRFTHDFYGAALNLLILGFIRPEYDYTSLEALVEDIKVDCEVAGQFPFSLFFSTYSHPLLAPPLFFSS
jgi:riboflavin kinase